MKNGSTIAVLMLLCGTAMLSIPPVIISPSLAFGQGVLEQNTAVDALCFNPVSSVNPLDVSNLVTQPCGPSGALPTLFTPPVGTPLSTFPPSASIMPIQSFPPSASIMPGLSPAINGLNDLSLGTTLPDSMNAIPSSPLLPQSSSLASPVPSPESSSSTPVTIYACMDPASGNIPVNSIGMSSATGCPFQTAPIVIIMDGLTNMVSTCFIAADMVTPASNCMSVNAPLQQQQQLQLAAPFTLPFQ